MPRELAHVRERIECKEVSTDASVGATDLPEGATQITPELTFEKRDGWVTYFHGLMQFFVTRKTIFRAFV